MKKVVTRGCSFALMMALLIGCVAPVMSQTKLATAGKRLSTPKAKVSKRTKTSATIKVKNTGKITGYRVYMKSSKKGKYKLTNFVFSRKFKITKLKSNKTYYVKLRAWRKLRKSRLSKTIVIKPYKKKTAKKPTATNKPSSVTSSSAA